MKPWIVRAIGLGCLLGFFSCHNLPQQVPPGWRFNRSVEGISEYTLVQNGLRVLLLPAPSRQATTLMIAYLTGSRHESPGKTGLAHLLEHMMFKGTPAHHDDGGQSVAQLIRRAGGILNATTNTDITAYYEIVPGADIGLLIEIEADRMRNLLLAESDFESERRVVESEREIHENTPEIKLEDAVWKTVFQKHPYGRKTIGELEDLRRLTPDDLRQFYDARYRPNQAVIFVHGSFDSAKILNKIRNSFESIPAAAPPSDLTPPEPEQLETRRVSIVADEETNAIMVAHPAPSPDHGDFPALELLSYVLAHGTMSRLSRDLIDSGVANSVSCHVERERDPALFVTNVRLNNGINSSAAEARILQIYDALMRHEVSPAELQKVKTGWKISRALSRDSLFGLLYEVRSAISISDWTSVVAMDRRIDAVSASDIRRVASSYLTPSRMTVGYLVSSQAKKANLEPASQMTALAHDSEPILALQKTGSSRWRHFPQFTPIQSATVGGIRLIVAKTKTNDLVSIAGSLEGAGRAGSHNPILADTAARLLSRGTHGYGRRDIRKQLESIGADVSFAADSRDLFISAACLQTNLDLVLTLMINQLRAPLFDLEELALVKQQLATEINAERTSPETLAGQELSRLLLPPAHPDYEPAVESKLAALDKVTFKMLRRFHLTRYRPDHLTLVLAGDVNIWQAKASLQQAVHRWDVIEAFPGPRRVVNINPKTIPTVRQIPVSGKSNTTVKLGTALPMTRLDSDYLPVALADHILGKGFNSRLFAQLRHKQGLTYHISTDLAGFSPDTQGFWQISLTLDPNRTNDGIREIKNVLTQFVQNGSQPDELAQHKTEIIGALQIETSASSGLAERILSNVMNGFAENYHERFPALLGAVSMEDVNRVSRAYWKPDTLAVVTAGAVLDKADEQTLSA